MSQPISLQAKAPLTPQESPPIKKTSPLPPTLFDAAAPFQQKPQKPLQHQIRLIGQTDPDKASRISQLLLNYTHTPREKRELQNLGINPLNLPERIRLLGGGETWIKGPLITLSGNNSDTKIFHIPEGCRYKDFRITKELKSKKGASYSITYVAAGSKAEIDALRKSKSQTKRKAALKARAIDLFDAAELSAALEADDMRGLKGSYSENYTHAALVVTASTVNPFLGTAYLELELDISIEPLQKKPPPPFLSKTKNKKKTQPLQVKKVKPSSNPSAPANPTYRPLS